MRRQKGKCLNCLTPDQLRFRDALIVPPALVATRMARLIPGTSRLGQCGECNEVCKMAELEKDKTKGKDGSRCAGCLKKSRAQDPPTATAAFQPSMQELLAANAGDKRKADSQPPPQVSPSLRTRSRGLTE